MEGPDVFRRLLQNGQKFRFHRFQGLLDFLLRHLKLLQIRSVQLPGIGQHRLVPVFLHVRQNSGHNFLYVDAGSYPGENLAIGYLPIFQNPNHVRSSTCRARFSWIARMAWSLN